jgi:hypothetical protein
MALDIETLLGTSHNGLRRGKNRMDAGGKNRSRRSHNRLKSTCLKQVAPQNKSIRSWAIQTMATPENCTSNQHASLFTKTTRFIAELTGLIGPQPPAAGNNYTPFPNCETKVIRKRPAQHQKKSRLGTRQT